MFFPKIDIKQDPARQWHRPDRQFFANGACQVLGYEFLEPYPNLGFRAHWIKPASGLTGNHIFVTDGRTFDYHGFTTEPRLLALAIRRGHRFYPGWDATLVDLPTEVLVSQQHSKKIDRLWLRQPTQFVHDALPRAQLFLDRYTFVDRHSDIRRHHLSASASCISGDAE
jgi:hypothetical protein